MKIFEHVVIQECLKHGIPLTVKKIEKNNCQLEVPGVYKNGNITLEYDQVLTATDRHGHKTTLRHYTDLLALNLDW